MKKNALIIVVLAVLGLAAIILFVKPVNNRTGESENETTNNITAQSTQRLEEKKPNEVIAAFPEGFPAELDRVTNSYHYIAPDSTQLQATLAYVSSKTVAENKEIFKDFFDEKGFTIANKRDEQGLAFFYATRNNTTLSVLIQDQNGEVSVSATYLAQ